MFLLVVMCFPPPPFSRLISLVSEIQAFPSSSFRRCHLYFAVEGEVEAICRFFLVSQVSWYFCSILSCCGILFNIRACLFASRLVLGAIADLCEPVPTERLSLGKLWLPSVNRVTF